MARPLTAGMQTAIAAASGTIIHFIQADFSGGTVYLTTASHDVDWNAQIWQGVGGILTFNAAEETSEERGAGLDLTLSGVTQTIIAIVLAQNYRGRNVNVYEAHLASDGTIIADPIEIFTGFMNSPFVMSEKRSHGGDAGTANIKTRVVSRLATFAYSRGIRSNLESHQAFFSGDTFFEHVAAIADEPIYWPGKTLRIAGRSPPGGPIDPTGSFWH